MLVSVLCALEGMCILLMLDSVCVDSVVQVISILTDCLPTCFIPY